MNSPLRRIHAGLAIVIMVAPLASSCTSNVQNYPESRDKAAGVTLSATAIPWSQISNNLHPNFSLTGDQALAQVAPFTLATQSAALNALGISASAGALVGPFHAPATGGSAQTLPGSVPNPTAPTGTPAGASLPTAPAANTSLALDPTTKYRAANSLFQYVQQLDSDLTSSILIGNYVPYVVRLKVGVLPYQQRLGYNLFENIAFFIDWNGRDTARDSSQQHQVPVVIPLLSTDDVERAAVSSAAENARQISGALSILAPYATGTASVNSVKASLLAQAGQQYDSLMTVARASENTIIARLGAQYQALSNPNVFDRWFGETTTQSLVGQTYDISTIVLMPKAYFKYNDNKEVKAPILRVFAASDFRRADTGDSLPAVNYNNKIANIAHLISSLPSANKNYTLTTDDLNNFMGLISTGNYQGFKDKIKKKIFLLSETNTNTQSNDSDDYEYWTLWAHLSEMLLDRGTQSITLRLPYLDDQDIDSVNRDQIVTVMDDGKTGMQATVSTGLTALSATLHATLVGVVCAPPDAATAITVQSPCSKARKGASGQAPDRVVKNVSLFSKGAAFDSSTGNVTFQFPSAVSQNLDAFAINYMEVGALGCYSEPGVDQKGNKVRQYHCPQLTAGKAYTVDSKHATPLVFDNVTYIQPPDDAAPAGKSPGSASPASSGPKKPEPGFSIKITATDITADKGVGAVNIAVSGVPAQHTVVVGVSGADLVSGTIGGTVGAATADGFLFPAGTAKALATLQLQNLNDGAKVTLTVTEKDEKNAVVGQKTLPALAVRTISSKPLSASSSLGLQVTQ